MRVVACWLSLLMVAMPTVAADSFSAGAAVESIMPDPLLPVSGGFGAPRPVTEQRGELTARAAVFQRGETTVGVVSLDVIGFPSVLADRIRQRVDRIPPHNLLVASTHTHSAPDCYAFPDGQGGHTGDLEYMNQVCDRAAAAVNAALDRLQPARLRIGTDEAAGKIAYNYYAPDLYDRRMSVVQAIGGDDQPILTLVNYAIHPEVLGADAGIISPDLVGPLCERIEQQAGGTAIFVNGALGGMVTADNRDLDRPRGDGRGYWQDDRTWDECLRIGHTMADEALRIVLAAPLQADPDLACYAAPLTVPVDSDELWGVVLYSPLQYPRDETNRTVTTRINLVNLGNAQILTIPGEALPNIGFYLKRHMRGTHNLLFGLTNDAFGYILTKVDFRSFPRYDYVSDVCLGEQTGEILIDTALTLVAESPPPR